jgi:L-threonylcarbamoyladenylate synthase
MQPERISASALLDINSSVRIAIGERIHSGQVFVYPTETIYGIGGRADNPLVEEKIIRVKKRAADNPMILLATSLTSFDGFSLQWTEAAKRCADAFWPGMLTMVLPAENVPQGVAVRVSDHPVVKALCESCRVPLFSTSANISGEEYDPDPQTIYTAVGSRCDFMIDAGMLPPSPPSTIARFSEAGSVTILREGCISAEAIQTVIGEAA